MIKKASLKALTLGITFSLAFTVSAFAEKEIKQPPGDAPKDAPAYIEITLPSPSSNNNLQAEALAGTTIGMKTEAWLASGKVSSYGMTTASQWCNDIRVGNWLYKGNTVIDAAEDAQDQGGTVAYAKVGDYTYESTSWYAESLHYVIDAYGQPYSDWTADNDL